MSYNLVNPTTGDLTRVAGGTLYADNPIGSIIPFGSSTIPTGYLLCNGQAVSRTTYSELFTVIGTAFGEGDGSTTFNVPDLREATTKGVGLSGKSNNHYDADGVALGEFVEDRLQAHTHANKTGSSTAGSEDWTMFATSQLLGGTAQTDYGVMGRFGNTTEVKSVGVNYIIKAKHIGIPADFIDAVDDAISDTTVDTVADGNMKPVTSNAVYDVLTDGTKELIVDSIKTTGQYQGSGSGLFIGKQDSNLEGGQLTLEHPMNSSFTGDLVIDVYGSRVRFFAGYNGSVRTFYIDFDNKTFGFE